MIPIARPLVGDAEAEAARAAVLSGWLTQGPQVAEFEREFAEAVGATHACAVANCTAALHLALLAVGVGAGDEVITVSHSFIATANSILCCGAKPVFIDIEPDTYNMDPTLIAAAITPRTRAILCVHQMGMPCDMRRILDVARAHHLPVVEDAACAIGSEIEIEAGQWQRIGRPHGDVACFSFHPRKVITTGDGGMLTTANPEWDRLFRLWRQHGMSIPDGVRHASPRVLFEDYPVSGFNYRMTDLQAAVGRHQLARLASIVVQRRRIAEEYGASLAGLAEVQLPLEPPWARTNWQSYCVRLSPRTDQRLVMQGMLDRGVASRRGIMCAHLERAYRDHERRSSLTHSERARDFCVLLPLYPQMTAAEQREVVSALHASIPRACGRTGAVETEAPVSAA